MVDFLQGTLHEAPHIFVQIFRVSRGILRVFINVLDKNIFKILKFLRQTLSLYPEQSTLFLDVQYNEIIQECKIKKQLKQKMQLPNTPLFI
jgi:hypothetical protein